ncbi:hypothetical protein DBR44_04555 [Aquitalea sp. FJL05]|uniref:hypothetical protein n=1 Tax=Aquitalea TaxID=407217 RepID=UPI000F5B7F28|nr:MULTISPECIES: hypothetical protein [Aquitalea]RQO76945.1 hypothetical protein DBR44_04555 [Aquitalea sp. FJL05]
MSKQLSFTDLEQSTKKKQTRREIFLTEMDKVMPWNKLEAALEPYYPKPGNGRRLSPGMEVSVEVKTGKRRVAEYFLSSLMEYGQESLRKR